MIQEFNLPLKDHFIFATSPLSLNNQWKKSKKAFKTFAYEYQFPFLIFGLKVSLIVIDALTKFIYLKI